MLFAATILAGAAPGQARAQSDETPGQLDEVIVTARRVAENLQDTPVAVTALSGADLESRQIRAAIDLQFVAPSVNIQQTVSSPFSANIGFRGQFQGTPVLPYEAAIATYVDGVYLGNGIGFLSVGALDVQRVEVLKGPQGTLYGRNTTGGAISIYTNLPGDRFEGRLSAGAGNFDLVRGDAMLNLPLGEKASLRLAGLYSKDAGYAREVNTGRKLQDQEAKVVRGTLRFNPDERLEVLLRAEVGRFESGGLAYKPLALTPNSAAALSIAAEARVTPAQALGLFAAQAAGSPYRVNLNVDPRSKLKTDFLASIISYDLGFATLKSITGFRSVHETSRTDADGTTFRIFEAAVQPPQIIRFKQWSQELNLTGEALNGRAKFAFGGFYSHLNGRHQENTVALFGLAAARSPASVNAHQITESVAVYGQGVFEVIPRVNLTAGLRWTSEDKTLSLNNFTPLGCTLPPATTVGGCFGRYPFKDENISYTAGVDWKPTDAVMLYAKTSRGFRSGGVNLRPTTDPISARPFDSELVYEHEVGVKSELFDRRLRLNADYYYQDYRNIQQNAPTLGASGVPVNTIINAAKARIQGVELEATALPVENLMLQGTLTYADAEYTSFRDRVTGADLSGRAFQLLSKWTYTLTAAYTVPTSFGDVRGQLDWYHRSGFNLFPSGGRQDLAVRPGYGLLNGQLSLRRDDGLSISLWAKNITREKYLEGMIDLTPAIGIVTGSYAKPRSYGIDITKTF